MEWHGCRGGGRMGSRSMLSTLCVLSRACNGEYQGGMNGYTPRGDSGWDLPRERRETDVLE